MDVKEIKVINKSNNPLPSYATPGSAGLDICAFLDRATTLQPMERKLIPTGLYFSIPVGYEIQVRPRSGLAIKHGITLVNAPGTIDSDYRGELGLLIINHSTEPYTIQPGERIAQLILAKYSQVTWQEVDTLDATERASGGFGHTGK